MPPCSLVLLPGLLCDHATWEPQFAGLAGLAECRIVDYGAAASIGAMAAAAMAGAPPRFAVAGHSMGGRVALELVRRVPERIERLALLDTGYQARPAGAAGEAEASQRADLLALARSAGMRAMGRQWSRQMVHPDRLADTALMTAILDMIERKTPDIFAAQIQALLGRPDATALLPAITCPTLLLCGRDDAWSPFARHAEMAALMPGCRLVGVDDCGHMATMERPDAVTDAMRDWLTD